MSSLPSATRVNSPAARAAGAEPLLAGDGFPGDHPVKGAPLRCASPLRGDGYAALDGAPVTGKALPRMKAVRL